MRGEILDSMRLALVLMLLPPILGILTGGNRPGGTLSPLFTSRDPGLAGRMREISQNLEIQLNDMMANQTVKYSSVNVTGLPYNASTKFVPRGMGELYNFTNMFIDLVHSKQLFPKGMITLPHRNAPPIFADPVKQWKMYVKHYGILAGVILAALLLAAILPWVGFVFCCCRCVGRCGAKSEQFDKKHDHCRKVFLNTILICVTTALLLGVVCAIVTNERIQDGTRDLPRNIKHNLKDVSLYLTTTKTETYVLLKDNFEELEVTLNKILQTSGKIVSEQLAEYSHAVSLMNLNDIVAGLNDIRSDLLNMNDITRKLRLNAQQLDNVVRGVKNSLLHTLADCASRECEEIMQKYRVNEMSVRVDFDKLPDVTSVLRNLTLLMDDNIVAEVSKGKDSFMKIQKDIQHAVNQTIPVVSASIRRAGVSLLDIAKNLTFVLDRVDSSINKEIVPRINTAQHYIDEYSPYRHYVGMSICAVLLAVLTCLTFGLLCGICGKRPDGYDDDCCDKGNGARSLMMAVTIIFTLTSILLVLIIAHMVVGIAAQRGICEPLKNPRNNNVMNLVEDYVKIAGVLHSKNPKSNITLQHIITSCHTNQTFFKVLMLDNMVDLNALQRYIDRYDINKTIIQLRQKINLSPGVVIFSETARQKLNDLANSGLSDIQFYKYTENLRDNITNINLDQLADKLKEVSDTLPPSQYEIKSSLDKNSFDLKHYHRDLVLPMAQQSEQLNESAMRLQEHIKFNHSSLTEAIHDLVKEVTTAQEFLNKDGPRYVQGLAVQFGQAFLFQVNSFLDHVINNTRNNIGKCGPISNAYNATMVATCNRILNPWNGFWASVGCCLLLFIPTIILSVKLSGLYQKSDPYPGPMGEAEYLYDAYADRERDHVPLAHIDKKYSGHGRHHHSSGYHESYEGPAIGYSDRERLPLPDPHQGHSHHHHDSRYSDYAPKNTWDFPNGGPPRYQPAANAPSLSTEYERPPPYYYPGPGERN